MRVNEIGVLIVEGDHVIDRMDNSVRKVSHFNDHGDNSASVYMEDGGVMALSEINANDIRLDSEVYGDNEPFFSPDHLHSMPETSKHLVYLNNYL